MFSSSTSTATLNYISAPVSSSYLTTYLAFLLRVQRKSATGELPSDSGDELVDSGDELIKRVTLESSLIISFPDHLFPAFLRH